MPVRSTDGRIPCSAITFAYPAEVYWVGSTGRSGDTVALRTGGQTLVATGQGLADQPGTACDRPRVQPMIFLPDAIP